MEALQEKISSYIAKTSGRDKVMRVIQFFLRFLKGILLKIRKQNKSQFESLIKKFDLVSSNLSNTRRLLRFGRTFGFQISLMKLIRIYQKRDQTKLLDKYNYLWSYVIPHGVSDLLSIIQFYCDHYLYLHKLGIFSQPKLYEKLNSFSDWSWFADILLSVYYSYFEICLLKNKIKEITSLAENNREITGMKPNSQDNVQKNEIEELKKKISDIKLEIAKLIFDLPVSYYYINDTYAHILWIGLTGTISSAIGVYQTW